MKIIYYNLMFWLLITTFSCSKKENRDNETENIPEVSNDGHMLLIDGKAFFWLGDTGWFLFTQSPGDAELYFKNRAEHRFNVIQMMVTRRMFNDSGFSADYKGDLPFDSFSPVKINESYFAHIDTLVSKAEKYGLLMVMAPTWGWNLDQVFSKDKPEEVYNWGLMLGKRYKNSRNVIWIVCGEYHKIAWDTEEKKPDSNPDSLELNLIENLARGLEDGHQGANLMTIHPDGWLSSSNHFHHAPWLDFNMIQSYNIGVGTEFDVLKDYKRIPYKPTILAEPGYENGGAGHTSFDVRYEGYHSVLNGAFGYTYGCSGVWNFRSDWKELLNCEGTVQMKYLRKLIESRPILNRVPSPELIKGFSGDWVKRTKLAAAHADDGAYAFIYFPGDTVQAEIRVSMISGQKANAWWYNPRDGEVYDLEGEKTNHPFAEFGCNMHQSYVFDPPGERGYGKDWVLILDDSDKGYGKP